MSDDPKELEREALRLLARARDLRGEPRLRAEAENMALVRDFLLGELNLRDFALKHGMTSPGMRALLVKRVEGEGIERAVVFVRATHVRGGYPHEDIFWACVREVEPGLFAAWAPGWAGKARGGLTREAALQALTDSTAATKAWQARASSGVWKFEKGFLVGEDAKREAALRYVR